VRKRTEAKRQEILAVAARLFMEKGFHDTSITAVADAMGGSRVTIYAYFPNKEALFREVLIRAANPVMRDLLLVLDGPEPLVERLRLFARGYLQVYASREATLVVRLVIAEFGDGKLVKALARAPYSAEWSRAVAAFKVAQQIGTLRHDRDAALMVNQFRALLDGGLPYQMLLGVRDACSEEDRSRAADAAVDMFMEAYRA